MKTFEQHLQELKKVGDKVVVPWEVLPKPAPQKGAVFGNGFLFFIAEPIVEGLEVRRVDKAEALAYRDGCDSHIGKPE